MRRTRLCVHRISAWAHFGPSNACRLEQSVKCVLVWLAVSRTPHRQPHSVCGSGGSSCLAFGFCRDPVVRGCRSFRDALELACGTALWMRQLAENNRRICRRGRISQGPGHKSRAGWLESCSPRYWRRSLTSRNSKAALFSFWLSHVPPLRFSTFWADVHGAFKSGAKPFHRQPYGAVADCAGSWLARPFRSGPAKTA
jgi:hypothetical protein